MGVGIKEKSVRYWQILRRRRQYQFFRAIIVGLCAGVLAVGFEKSLAFVEDARYEFLAWISPYQIKWIVVPLICAIVTGGVGYLTKTVAPEASGSGIPNVKAILLNLRQLKRKVLPVKFIGGILAIGAGFSLGREGPTVQMGAVTGELVSDVLKVPKRYRPQLIAAGAGAGLAAAFNAPLAGFIFVIEELQKELSPLTYGTAIIAAVVADIMTRTFTGQLPSFHVHGFPTPSLMLFPFFVVLGVFCGVFGTLFNKAILWGSATFSRISLGNGFVRAAIVGVGIGLIALWIPHAGGGGQFTAEKILQGHASDLLKSNPIVNSVALYLIILLVVKFAATVLSYASGVPGGIFAPLLVLGAITGAVTGQICAWLFPAVVQTPATFGVLGMAAMFASIVRAPITGTVLILEMTGNYEILLALLVTSIISYLVADHMGTKPIYEALLDQDLERSGGMTNVEMSEPMMAYVTVEPHSSMDGVRLKDLVLPKGCLIVHIDRGGRGLLPGGNTHISAADQLSVLTSVPEALMEIRRLAESRH